MQRAIAVLLLGALLPGCSDSTSPPRTEPQPTLADVYEIESVDGASLPVPLILLGDAVSLTFSELHLGGLQLSWSIGYDKGEPSSSTGFYLLTSYRLPTQDSLVWPAAAGVEPEFFAKAVGETLTLVVVPNGEAGSMGEAMGGPHVWRFRARRED